MPAQTSFDLEEIITDWAWREYQLNESRKERNLRKKHEKQARYVGVQIDWSKVRFRDDTSWAGLAEDSLEDSDKNKNKAGAPNQLGPLNQGLHSSGAQKADGGVPHSNILFQTKFTNNTKEVQEYTMKTEKTTTSVCETAIESCFTQGMELSVKLATPGEIFEANAGYSRELALTSSEGESIEEQVNWGVESKITVRPMHMAEAQLVVNEKKYKGDFVIESQIKGQVSVTFTNLRDNNSAFKAISHKLSDIVQEYLEEQSRMGKPLNFVENRDGVIHVRTKGTCKFRYGINQEVKVSQIPLDGADSQK